MLLRFIAKCVFKLNFKMSEREEGEISDIDLEDISDCSLNSFNEAIEKPSYYDCDIGITLSDSSSLSHEDKYINRNKRKRLYSKTNYKNSKSKYAPSKQKYSDTPSKSESSKSEDEVIDTSMIKKLNKAVRVTNTNTESSLRTRLNHMIKGKSRSDDTENKDVHDQITDKETYLMHNSDDDKDEAYQLRIDALRSAILKKHQKRQKKLTTEITTYDKQKENCVPQEDINNISPETNETDEPMLVENTDIPKDINKSLDEDEDVLRALLLSSISKKISESKNKVTELSKTPNENVKELKNSNVENNTSDLSLNIKPLVINIGADTDSDSDEMIKEQFANNLSQLLRRARDENQNKQIKNETKNVTSIDKLPLDIKLKCEKLKRQLDILNTNKNKQLQNKLESNKKKSIYTKIINNTNFNIKSNSKLKSTYVNLYNKKKYLREFPNVQNHTKSTTNKSDIRNSANIIQLPPKQKIIINEKPVVQKRLLEGKYKALSSIVQQTKAARIARDKAGADVNRLIEELKKARLHYTEYHWEYKSSLQKYLLMKSAIDEQRKKSSWVKTDLGEKIEAPSKQQDVNINSTSKQNIEIKEKDPIENKNISSQNIIQEKKPLESNETLIINEKRKLIDNDPTIEMCPFDLQGTCRDNECVYRHIA